MTSVTPFSQMTRPRHTLGVLFAVFNCLVLSLNPGYGQSVSFRTYMNPVIPGDHPDCTVTKVGKDFYTTGSSFNPTPVIYHSTDLVHWEAIAQPVSAAWMNYGDSPAGGCWGGQMVYHNGKYWDFFARNGNGSGMYFVTADDPRGPWSMPTQMQCPSSVPGLGYDNSIFIDDDGSWYLLVKNLQVNNWIVQLGNDGQPAGAIYNLCWINPAPAYPFSWAEGPVMWKHRGYYYYCFARDVSGGQKVFRSATLTDDQSSWVNLGDFFDLNDPLKPQALFQGPNHASAAVVLDDSTSWVLHPLWRSANSNEWYGQGRQGLLNQVRYDADGKPTADYPDNVPRNAPKLPGGGIPWMVPHSDSFSSAKLNPEWSFLGYTPADSWSLAQRSGWLTLSPKNRLYPNTVIKNDGEHAYAIVTRLDFQPAKAADQAGIWIFNGLQTVDARLYGSIDSAGKRIVGFRYKTTLYTVSSPSAGSIVWLKLVRVNHLLTGYCSADGGSWIPVGDSINVADMDNLQPEYNKWTGNRQGLFVLGSPADFDFYVYRDAFTPILAECPANQSGTTVSVSRSGLTSLGNIHDNDWAIYAGVEFGNADYRRRPDSLEITASSASSGGVVEVWLDSLDSGTKIAECPVGTTGSWDTFRSFRTKVLAPVSGMHDLYLKFRGTGSGSLFSLQWLTFLDASASGTSVGGNSSGELPGSFRLEQNYPNPFNPETVIRYQLAAGCDVHLEVFDLLGREVATLVDEFEPAGSHTVQLSAFSARQSSGCYYYRLKAGDFFQTKMMSLLK